MTKETLDRPEVGVTCPEGVRIRFNDRFYSEMVTFNETVETLLTFLTPGRQI